MKRIVFAVFLFSLLLMPAPSEASRPDLAPPDPDHPEEFFKNQDLGEYVVVDGLDYPVPKNIDRRPGLPKNKKETAKAPVQELESYTAIDPNEY